MQVTKLTIASTRGPNKEPGSGYVTFSDGKEYHWSRAWDGGLQLGGQRFRCGGWEDFHIPAPPKRAAILEAAINGN
jgi:hypothetical protein